MDKWSEVKCAKGEARRWGTAMHFNKWRVLRPPGSTPDTSEDKTRECPHVSSGNNVHALNEETFFCPACSFSLKTHSWLCWGAGNGQRRARGTPLRDRRALRRSCGIESFCLLLQMRWSPRGARRRSERTETPSGCRRNQTPWSMLCKHVAADEEEEERFFFFFTWPLYESGTADWSITATVWTAFSSTEVCKPEALKPHAALPSLHCDSLALKKNDNSLNK